jgi:hypothetical protein
VPARLHFQYHAGQNGFPWPGTVGFEHEASFSVSRRLSGAGGHTPQRDHTQYGEKAHGSKIVDPSQSYSKFP